MVVSAETSADLEAVSGRRASAAAPRRRTWSGLVSRCALASNWLPAAATSRRSFSRAFLSSRTTVTAARTAATTPIAATSRRLRAARWLTDA
ncbi:hypothetical protein ACIBQ6_13260 [Nonomuraea sp. NPDC049655]|uniref:hypothetical protein n=1 Tax=Nonomuraea sp. NPDC049655 TaxID=3364355 RepID=UPI0037A19BB0